MVCPEPGGGATLNSEIPVVNNVGGKTIVVSIGAGGTKAKSTTALAKSATDGGETTLTYNSVTYTAPGGVGGINSANEANLTESFEGIKVYQFVKDYGTSQYYGGYYNGVVAPIGLQGDTTSNLFYFAYPGGKTEPVYSNSGVYSNPPVIFINMGIPEFFEPSTGIYYAQPGNFFEWRLFVGKSTDDYDEYKNSTDGFSMYQTLNPGAGGFGAVYRTTSVRYGGDGQPGIAVIRYWGYE